MHHVVIIGGGFGGLHAARCLARAPVEITLLDRQNYHLFQPLLYQVATGALSPANIASPLRALFKRQRNTAVLLAEARDIDIVGRQVLLDKGVLVFDTLILAAGSSHSYFGHPEWEARAPSLKTLDDATTIRRRILSAFEAAERAGDPYEVRIWLTFVVVGGGPTGVELVGQIAEIAMHTLKNEFRSINPAEAQVYLIEAMDRVLPPYAPELSAKAEKALKDLKVRVLTSARVTGVELEAITYEQAGKCQRIATRTVVWAAGIQASPLGRRLAGVAGAATDRSGRVLVEPDLTVPGHPEIFVIGDMAHFDDPAGQTLPAIAPVAVQQGRYVAKLIRRRLSGNTLPAFRYKDYGIMATIGRYRAVADLRFIRVSGPLAWLIWLFVHLMALVQFQNRLLVFIQWGWHYVTRNRSARLITRESPHRNGNPVAGRQSEAKDTGASIDVVQEASEESFPASDAPAWTTFSLFRGPKD